VIGDRCYHVPTAPGQGVCTCLDELMWLRLLVELQARRIAQLEHAAQQHPPQLLDFTKRDHR
jgi:hypothetical protein